jgi:hypothetical protein
MRVLFRPFRYNKALHLNAIGLKIFQRYHPQEQVLPGVFSSPCDTKFLCLSIRCSIPSIISVIGDNKFMYIVIVWPMGTVNCFFMEFAGSFLIRSHYFYFSIDNLRILSEVKKRR